jgi:outer membrane protein assembly factor BamB
MQIRNERLPLRHRTVVATFVTLFLSTATLSYGDGWSGFQNGGNLAISDDDYPVEWSPESGISWEKELAGYGQSAPVIHDKTIFVTSVSGGMKETCHVEAFEARTGKQAWQFDTENSSPIKSTAYVSKAAPSPVCDSAGVIALFEGGNIVALSPSGELRWQRDLVADLGAIDSRHGLSSSLEQNDEAIFVWVERSETPYVLAIAKSNGKTIWKADGIGVTSWSSPRLIPVAKSAHLVLSGIGKLIGLDPATGKRLWEFTEIAGNSTPTPIPIGGNRFLIGATVGRGESGSGSAAKSNGVIEIADSPAGGYTAKYVWHAKAATSSFGSPIAHNGLAWFVNRSGVIYCLDLTTGEQKYASRTPGSIWATPVVIGDFLYLFGKNGTTTVIKTGPEYEAVAENSLWDAVPSKEGQPSFGGPVLYAASPANSQLVLRKGDRIFAIAR